MNEAHFEATWIKEVKLIPGATVKTDEPLARYTSMKVGGPADSFIQVENHLALAQTLRALDRESVPVYLLGNGSNILISDRGIRGAVLRLAGEFKRVEWRKADDGVWIVAGAAYAVARLARETVRKGYTGLEFAEGIPASVGGALVMNAGAYGSEMQKVVDRVEAVTRAGQELNLRRPELSFSYRSSSLPVGTVVTRVWLRLLAGEPHSMREKLNELLTRRKKSQPSGFPNSGSMFQNPPGDFAGRLIEAAGLKGRRIGRAQISERHANFIVNLGGAKADDIRELMDVARLEVKKKFGIDLNPEVRMVGAWSGGPGIVERDGGN